MKYHINSTVMPEYGNHSVLLLFLIKNIGNNLE